MNENTGKDGHVSMKYIAKQQTETSVTIVIYLFKMFFVCFGVFCLFFCGVGMVESCCFFLTSSQ